jgi:hypothetical protein
VIVLDLGMMGIATYKKFTHPDADVIYDGISVWSVHGKFDELVDPVMKQHGLASVVE